MPVSVCFFPATINCSFYDAQTGDCGMLEKVQCQKKAEGIFLKGTVTYDSTLCDYRS